MAVLPVSEVVLYLVESYVVLFRLSLQSLYSLCQRELSPEYLSSLFSPQMSMVNHIINISLF